MVVLNFLGRKNGSIELFGKIQKMVVLNFLGRKQLRLSC